MGGRGGTQQVVRWPTCPLRSIRAADSLPFWSFPSDADAPAGHSPRLLVCSAMPVRLTLPAAMFMTLIPCGRSACTRGHDSQGLGQRQAGGGCSSCTTTGNPVYAALLPDAH